MSLFTPRSGKANYIKPRGKHFYYHGAIPPEFRQFFDGKTEWNIRLEAATDAGRRAEARALAQQHNKTMTFDVIEPTYLRASNDLSMRIDLSLFSKLKWSGKTGQRAKMYPTLKTGYTNDEETQFFR